jgi:hypothetical protein
VQRDLERGPNPVVALLPRYLFTSALLSQLVALGISLPAIADIARGLRATAVVVGVVALTVLLVDYMITPAGSPAQRLRGWTSGWTSTMVFGFMLAWFLDAEGVPAVAVFLVELVSFAIGVLCARDVLRLMPIDTYGDVAA